MPERSGRKIEEAGGFGVLCFLSSLCFLIPLPACFQVPHSAVIMGKSSVFPRRPNFEFIHLDIQLAIQRLDSTAGPVEMCEESELSLVFRGRSRVAGGGAA
jgi:hypothetical protein